MRRFFWVSALVLPAMVGALGCSDAQRAEPPAAPVAEAQFAGDAACASCHASIYESYKRSGMGQSVSRFDPDAAPERFPAGLRIYSAPRDLYYTPFVRGDTLYQREFRLDAAGRVVYERTHAADWVIGSGKATRSYLMSVNGYVTEMPLTWYVERGLWDLSPGYEQVNDRFSRPTNELCITCHNAVPAHTPFTQAHYTEMPLGISCERCHGPSAEHVEARLAGFEPDEGEAEAGVVNPARLSRALQLDVCQQCHLTGTTVFAPGEGPDTYRPGQPLSQNRAVFATAEQVRDPERFGISSHAARLAQSACFVQSAMTCTTCHDPHVPVEELKPDHYNTVCQSCHTPDAAHPDATVCGRTSGSAALTGNCVSCHIQKSGTSDIPHVTFTDHWIRRTLPPARRPEDIERVRLRREPVTLVRVTGDGTPLPARATTEEALAYLDFYETKQPIPGYLPRINAGVREGLGGGYEQAEARMALGRVLLLQDSTAAAVQVLREAADRYPARPDVRLWLGKAYHAAGRYAEAASVLQEAVRLQPALLDAHHALAEALEAAGRLGEAENAYRALLARDPVHLPGAWNNLGFVLMQQQRLGPADSALARALALDPDLTIALVNRASVALVQQRLDDAKALLDRALARSPDNPAALGNRAVVAAQQGQYAEARRYLNRLLQVTPNDARARALLAQLEGQG